MKMEHVPKPLSEEEAREEANILKARLEINPNNGRIPTTEIERKAVDYTEGGREPTAEDYSAALAAVEELRELAAQETTPEKIKDVFGHLAADSALAGWTFLWAIMEPVENIHNRQEFLAALSKHYKIDFSKRHEIKSWAARFNGAAYQLRKLSEEAKKYEEN